MPEADATTEPSRRNFTAWLLRFFSAFHLRVYRATHGMVGAMLFDPPYPWRLLPMCLLTTTGRKSGIQRTLPLLYLGDGDRVVLVASYGGKPVHPLWYTNLLAHPEAIVQTGGLIRKMRARTASPTERAELWIRMVKLYPGYEKYQRRTEREIPLVICEPL
jgi:deazaflavin-dependent oxidoreductase (nitroreductase family)